VAQVSRHGIAVKPIFGLLKRNYFLGFQKNVGLVVYTNKAKLFCIQFKNVGLSTKSNIPFFISI